MQVKRDAKQFEYRIYQSLNLEKLGINREYAGSESNRRGPDGACGRTAQKGCSNVPSPTED